jgi:hypothetical protein
MCNKSNVIINTNSCEINNPDKKLYVNENYKIIMDDEESIIKELLNGVNSKWNVIL